MTKYYETGNADLKIRTAEQKDAPLILELIKGLAEYEKMSDKVSVTAEQLRENLFEKKQAEVLIAEYKGEEIGYAMFFSNFSSFIGKAGLYLEDLFIRPEARGCGAGKALFACVAEIAAERNMEKVEWACLDWNEPSIRFYNQLGARPLDEWKIYRLSGEALPALAALISSRN